MDWTAYVDLYCERTAPGLAGEPLNALSNLAFWLAAWVVWRAARGREPAWDLRGLALLIALVGAGSLAFHLYAQRWAGLLDVLFIALYLHAYVAVFLHRVAGLRWRLAWLGAPGFWLFARAVDAGSGVLAADPVLRGTVGYLPALLGLLALALIAASLRDARWRVLAGAAVLFAASLALRELDLPLCPRWPPGTHFLWHLLNAGVLWLTARALARDIAGGRA